RGPGAPRAFTATRVGRSVHLAWAPPSYGAGSYVIEVGSSSGAADVRTFPVSGTTGVIHDFPFGTSYLRVRSVATGAASNEAVVTVNAASCTAPPGAPVGFTAGAHGSSVHLSWQPGSGDAPTGYVLYVGSAPGRQDLMTVPFPATATGATATAADGIYALRLVATNACGSSPWGAEALLMVGHGALPSSAPGAPASLTGTVAGNLVTLTWTPPAGGVPVTRYLIEATTPAGPVSFDTGNPATAFSHPDTPAGEYVVRVRAGNAAGFGPPSPPVTIVVP